MATAKKTEEPVAEEPQAEEPQVAPPEEPTPGIICAVCGLPATRVSTSTAYSPAYYCDDHATQAVNEPTKTIGS